MKKIIALLLLAALVLSGCAIGKQSESDNGADSGVVTEGAGSEEKSTEMQTEQLKIPEATVGEEVDENIPEEVIKYAEDIIKARVEAVSASSGLVIEKSVITGIKGIDTGTAALDYSINMYLLEYRLSPKLPYEALQTEGLIFENGAITEKESGGQPYLIVYIGDAGGERRVERVCVTYTSEIDTYDTEEMLALYGNKFTAATMELYEKNKISLGGTN